MGSLAFSANASSIGQCIPGFTDYVIVQVVDNNYRFIDGASVHINYQLDKTTNQGYINTKNYTTNSSGTVNITLHNIETDPDKVNCDFTVYATYGSKTTDGKYTVDSRPSQIIVLVDAYPVTLRITDQFKNPIPGVRVWINDVERITDKFGFVTAYANPGSVSVLIEYLDGTLTDSFKVNADFYQDISLQIYSLTINSMDDFGTPLVANATVGGENYTSNINGTITVSRIMNFAPAATVTYGNVQKNIDIDLRVKNKYNAIFDFTPPKIGEVTISQTKKTSKLMIPISDPGQYASGIAQGGVIVKYRIGDSGNWIDTSTYLTGKDKYAAEIPIQKNDAIVHFSIEAKDNDGNRANLEGEFVFIQSTVPQNNTVPEENTTQIVSPSEVTSDQFPLLYVVAGFIILIVVIYAVYRYIRGRGESNASA